MRTIRLLLLLFVSFTVLQAQSDRWKSIREKTEIKLNEIANSTRGIVGVVALDMTSGEKFAVNSEMQLPQGSAIKIPILMEVFKMAHEGKFKLTDLFWVDSADQVGGSGILGQLGNHTTQMSVHDLSILMIVLSDNTATNMLIDLVGMENINKTLKEVGLSKTRVQRKMMDQEASARGDENLSTPMEAARIMEMLFKGTFVSREVCDEIIAILQKGKSGTIASALPSGIPVSFKPGGIAGVTTEWAIVHLKENPYVLVVMESYGLEGDINPAVSNISKLIYEYFWRKGVASPYGSYDVKW